MENILFVSAHTDDLEVMDRRTFKHFIDRDCSVHVISLTDGPWTVENWRLYHDSLTTYYGLISGTKRAQGLITQKSING